MLRGFFVFFFFSSRRRHTRSLRDWSSDVCSSDLQLEREKALVEQIAALEAERTGQLEHALEHRIVVEQAKGVRMGREDLSVREAFERLRAVARSRRRPVEELARDVAAGRPLPAVTRSP